MASFGGSQHPRQIQVVLLSNLLRGTPNLLNINLLHHLEHLVDVLVVKLVIPDPVDHLHIVVYALSEVGGIDIALLGSVGELGHVEGVGHLGVDGFCKVWQELLVQVHRMEIPVELSHIVEGVLLVIKVLVSLELVDSVLPEYLPLLARLVKLLFFFLLLD